MKNIAKACVVIVLAWLIMGAILGLNYNLSRNGGAVVLWMNPFTAQSTIMVG